MLRTTLSVLAAAALLAAAGCGSDDDEGSAAPPAETTATAAAGGDTAAQGSGSTLRLSADPGGALKFDRARLTAKAGKVTITMDNPSGAGIPHAVAIEGNGVDEDGQTAQPGGTSTVSADLKAGTYTFYCPVGQHEQAGMKGTLEVQ